MPHDAFMQHEKRIVRIVLGPQDLENVDFLLKVLHISVAPDLIRFLLQRVAEEKRSEQMRYGNSGGGGGSVTREPKPEKLPIAAQIAQRTIELLALDNEVLTEELKNAGVFDRDSTDESTGRSVTWYITLNNLGQRVVRNDVTSAHGKSENQLGFVEDWVRKAVKEKRI